MKSYAFHRIMMLIGVIVLVALLFIVILSFSRQDMVDKEFSWLFNSMLQINDCKEIDRKKNWYRIFKLSDKGVNLFTTNEFREIGYTGWRRFSEALILCGGVVLDGDANAILVNEKSGSDGFDFIKMFVNVDSSELILVYGKTYGK